MYLSLLLMIYFPKVVVVSPAVSAELDSLALVPLLSSAVVLAVMVALSVVVMPESLWSTDHLAPSTPDSALMEPSSRRPSASGRRRFKTPAISARRRRQTYHSHLPVSNDPQTRSTSSSQSFVQSRNMVGAHLTPVIWSIDHSESHT